MIRVRQFIPNDFPVVQEIYQQGINSGNATFETQVKSWQQWHQAMLKPCRLIAEKEGEILGWAALSPISARPVYGGVAEVSVYTAASARGQGIGKQLMSQLITSSEEHNIWTLQAAIFPENKASIILHQKHGFNTLGVRKQLGKLKGVWRDVVLMERRSTQVGID
ncbi:GNAT family N-acetyltransferase [Thalassomonas haliotis]|uniref:N-acetyltransferase n=1 Tax=Thalassomonas haliotis TaxID=485448 RepID=A0ABY7VJ86_9GAMM|nr:GNAT family N-acetyltransferase [Thalassomonas haliotis]WDE13789.1 N-acetyltransferase [Thalassomonas haliotis]